MRSHKLMTLTAFAFAVPVVVPAGNLYLDANHASAADTADAGTAGKPFKTWEFALLRLPSGSDTTLWVAPGHYVITNAAVGNDGVTALRHITIRGTGASRDDVVIDGGGKYRGIDALKLLDGYKLTVSSLTITNCASTNGYAAICYQDVSANKGQLMVTNCVIADCHATGGAKAPGAFRLSSWGSLLVDSVVHDVSNEPSGDAHHGGAVTSGGDGTPKIQKNLFYNCMALGKSTGGGAVNSQAEIRDCVFSNNVAVMAGGALARCFGTVSNCCFCYNRVLGDYSRGKSWDGVTFYFGGGAVSGLDHSPGSGWGKSLSGTLKNCVFYRNSAPCGAATDNVRDLIDCEFIENESTAQYGGTAAYSRWSKYQFEVVSEGKVSRCGFIGNYNSSDGSNGTNGCGAGVISHMVHSVTVEDCAFTSNRAYAGSCVYIAGTTNYIPINVKGCTFRANATPVFNTNGFVAGGAVYMSGEKSSLYMTNCVFTGNISTGYAGGLLLQGKAVVDGCTFVSNYAGSAGAAIFVGKVANSEPVVIKDSRIEGNATTTYLTPEHNGGMVTAVSSARICVSNCVVANNKASCHAGGFHLDCSYVIDSCVITNNYAAAWGGGLFVRNSGLTPRPVIRNSIIAFNSANDGGGIDLARGGALLVDACSIVSNISRYAYNAAAGCYPGGIKGQSSDVVVSNTVYAGNYNNNPIGPTPPMSFDKGEGLGRAWNCCLWPVPDPDTAGFQLEMGCVRADPKLIFTNSAPCLAVGSPCLNAGVNEPWMTGAKDALGNDRIFANVVDIGACERIYDTSGTILIFR